MNSQKKINLGDKVEAISKKDNVRFEGIALPQEHDPNYLVIKLSSGYNIGIRIEDYEINVIEKKECEKKAENLENEERGEIAILGCGGTISSKVEYSTGAVYPSFSPKELLSAFPKLTEIAKIHSKLLFQLFSEDMSIHHWRIVAEETYNQIKDGVEGIVIMHGTDTMHYTSAALSFALENLSVPVIFVGAQRSSDRPSSDNELNLYNAVFSAKSDIAHVSVCMHSSLNDDNAYLHLGTRVRKMHTSRRDAFQSINSSPLAVVNYAEKKIVPLLPYTKKDKNRKVSLKAHFSENVGILYVHPGIKPEFIEKFSIFDGIVIAGTGLGHVPTNPHNDKFTKSILPSLRSLSERGIILVMASQTIFGRINMNVYLTGRLLQEIGVIGDGADWTIESAFVKLSWVLGKEKNYSRVKELMLTNIAGEISNRSLI